MEERDDRDSSKSGVAFGGDCLAGLVVVVSFDSEDPLGEVDVVPAKRGDLSPAKATVEGEAPEGTA